MGMRLKRKLFFTMNNFNPNMTSKASFKLPKTMNNLPPTPSIKQPTFWNRAGTFGKKTLKGVGYLGAGTLALGGLALAGLKNAVSDG